MTSEGRPAEILLVQDDVADELFLRVQNLSVQGYVRKPVDFDALTEIVRSQRALAFRCAAAVGSDDPVAAARPGAAGSRIRQRASSGSERSNPWR
ncbi:hypothetical protein ACIA5C_20880 [Actinoplanes sp. NPDC051343]|uniref:hypothetical protein n=1 Tax=Actinoplanes sp. NPDC051343 TaxID=3363906 RepID=UPI00379B8EBF